MLMFIACFVAVRSYRSSLILRVNKGDDDNGSIIIVTIPFKVHLNDDIEMN